ncbi:hypothetical protein [Deefgea piscis]|uniref:hypothetical protein n=1 Tax=Deefgea piscis TaxID=2739061 RepID=UPI001C822FFA|nr:hypothetical protein [Deefgea piscis]QZA80715.1 hypothetical protein K4H25_14625 [Deefgea piscis]
MRNLNLVSETEEIQLMPTIRAKAQELGNNPVKKAKQYDGLTKEDLAGDLLNASIASYFAATGAQANFAARSAGVTRYGLPSYGYFHTSAKTDYWFGIPKRVSFPGVTIDVKHWKNTVTSNDADNAKRISFVQQIGTIASSNEHLIPEKLFTNEQNPGEGVSAVKALAVAAAQGLRIYTINQNNVNSAVNQLTVSTEIKDEIRNAANSGKQITVSQNNVNIGGWTGAGYIILDPDTGAGAYKISGGANGGWFSGLAAGVSIGATFAFIGLASLETLTLLGVASPFFIMMAVLIIAIVMLVIQAIIIAALVDYYSSDEKSLGCFYGGFGWGSSMAGLISGQGYISSVLGFLLGSLFAMKLGGSTAKECVVI